MDAGVITAIGGAAGTTLLALGGGIRFVWLRIDRRIRALEGEIKAYSKDLDDCKERDRANRSLMSELIFALRLLADEVGSTNPTSPLLAHVRSMLAKVYPIAPTPADMIDTLGDMR